MIRPRFVPPPDTGTIVTGPAAGSDGHQTVQVRLDGGGLTVTASVLYTCAHATPANPVGTYQVGDRVAVQMYPYGSTVTGMVLGVIW